MLSTIISALCVLQDSQGAYLYLCQTIYYPQLSEQFGFQHEKSTVNQVVLLTENIKDFFKAKKKADTIFFNLTVAHDTV